MCCRNRCIALIYRVCAFAIVGITLIYDFGLFDGTFKRVNILYFTILSNLFCFFLFLGLVIKTVVDIRTDGWFGTSSISPHIKGGVIICILLTMIVYHFILIPYALRVNPYQTLKVTDVVFHYIMPFFTLLDWIVFDEKNRFKWFDPILWIMIPYLYVGFVFFQAQYDLIDRISNHMNRYIYIFLDIGSIGIMSVGINIISLTIAFLILGYFIYGFDKIKLG